MTVLVTGATGLVGRAVAARLALEHHVTALVRDGNAPLPERVQPIVGALGNPMLSALLAQRPFDAIVHAAANLSKTLDAPEIASTNCFGTQQLAGFATAWPARRFIFLSSVAVIGSPTTLPLNEVHPIAPPTAYHASKLFGEYLTALLAPRGIESIVLRLTAPVGPFMPRDRFLPVLVARASRNEPIVLLGAGGRHQDYVDVRDVAEAVAASLVSSSHGECFLIGAGRTVANRDLAAQVVALLGSSSPISFQGVDPEEHVRWQVSIAKAQAMLGFEPRISLAQTIRDLAAHHAPGAH